jgi:ribonuclease HI
MSDSTTPVVLFTDGACRGNPGAGGWAAIIIDGGEKEISGFESYTTNQRMELTAAIQGLGAISEPRSVALYTDSLYVMNCFVQRWWVRWEKNGWLNTGRQPVANRDLWQRLLVETRRHDVTWNWVKGHSGHPLNERVDRLARQAIVDATKR